MDRTVLVREKRLLDRGLTCDPCVCGDPETWHPACYAGLTNEEIQMRYKKVFAKLRRAHVRRAGRAAATVIKLVKL